MMNFLPTTLLISKICPDGVETTTFAMLAGVSNFGQQVAGYGECTMRLRGLFAPLLEI